MTPSRVSIFAAIDDPEVFAPWFRDRASWQAWFAFIAALFALPMTEEQKAIYRECTGRSAEPARAFREAWLICGRRAGKSFTLALLAVFIGVFCDWQPHLQRGERATILIIAADRRQARSIMRFIKGLLNGVPMLSAMIERETAETIDLSNRLTIEISTASFRRTRGYAIAAALLDELAFWPTEESANPDQEIIDAIKPGMAQFPEPLLLCASSPYARRGALYEAHRKYFGQDTTTALVWQAPTRRMNPTVPQSVIDDAMERDVEKASAEYGAQFRSDVSGFLTDVAIRGCIDDEVHERAPDLKLDYVGYCDASSGGGADSFCVAVSHRENKTAVLDAVREWKPPFNPEATAAEACAFLKTYRISTVYGDNYAAEFVRSLFQKNGVFYKPSELSTSEIFLEALPSINSHAYVLLDNNRLFQQLVGLERKTARSGHDSVGHAPGRHDDLACAAIGSLVYAFKTSAGVVMSRAERERRYREEHGYEYDQLGSDPLDGW